MRTIIALTSVFPASLKPPTGTAAKEGAAAAARHSANSDRGGESMVRRGLLPVEDDGRR